MMMNHSKKESVAPRISRARKSLLALSLAIPACATLAFADDRDNRPRVAFPDARVGLDVTLGFQPLPQDVIDGYQQDLGDYGQWINTQAYGRCWVPNDRPDGWRPYTNGHWLSTDEGWTWVSEGDEVAWGDTVYHYGRWFDDPDNGWVWVPGAVWAPSWVTWREGDGYSAWAPLPPECADGVNVTPEDAEAYVRPEDYVVVDQRYMDEPGIYHHFEVNNVTVFNRTTNITRISYVDNRAVNQGVSIAHVQQRSGRAIQTVHLQRATSAAEARKMVSEGKPVQYAPAHVEAHIKAHPIVARNAANPKEIAARRTAVPRREPGKPPAKHVNTGKTPPHEGPEVKPKKEPVHEETKPKPREREAVKPEPRAHEEPKTPGHVEEKPKQQHDPAKKPERPEEKREEK